jgi:serine/threonine protein kinase
MVGETVSHYRILEELGEGSTGVVYKGEDMVLHRLVAIKFPSDALVRKEDARARFLYEARMAATLVHQNVTVVHEVGEHDGHPFIVMEFVDGRNLRSTIRDEGPFSPRQSVDIAIQICEGLKAVHERLVIHRDIKTENILLTPNRQAKIADCGLAARFVNAEGLAKVLGLAGTTAYMSPEQLRGEQLDQRSDIFSAGIVLYEMVTGHLPFEAKHPDALMYLILNADPTPLEVHRDSIPPALGEVIYKALEKDPAARYQHVEQMIHDLRKIGMTLNDERVQ